MATEAAPTRMATPIMVNKRQLVAISQQYWLDCLQLRRRLPAPSAPKQQSDPAGVHSSNGPEQFPGWFVRASQAAQLLPVVGTRSPQSAELAGLIGQRLRVALGRTAPNWRQRSHGALGNERGKLPPNSLNLREKLNLCLNCRCLRGLKAFVCTSTLGYSPHWLTRRWWQWLRMRSNQGVWPKGRATR